MPLSAFAQSPSRIMTVAIAQDFLNEQIALHTKSPLIQEMKVELDPDHEQIFLKGVVQIPVEELRAINLEPKLGAFHFQVAIKPEISKEGYLVLEFPLAETYFYPSTAKDPSKERVIIPVQLLSLALASARGYLAALSGDFSGFDRRTAKLDALMKALNHSISVEKNPDAREDLKNQRETLKLQIAAVPMERKQLQSASKEVENVLGFTGEKELNLNQELSARRNALVLKIKISQLAPFLSDVELGAIRVVHNKKDGKGENYFALDLNSTTKTPVVTQPNTGNRTKLAVVPSMVMRLNQALFESEALLNAEKKSAPSQLQNLKFTLKEDGIHAEGDYKTLLILSLHFETIIDLVSTAPDLFEVRVRDLKVAGLDFEFLSKYVLEVMKKRLDLALKGICTFKYLGEENDHARALQVTVDPKALIPAFPGLHLIDVDVKEGEFLLKIGKI
jgi:hypothetical protein